MSNFETFAGIPTCGYETEATAPVQNQNDRDVKNGGKGLPILCIKYTKLTDPHQSTFLERLMKIRQMFAGDPFANVNSFNCNNIRIPAYHITMSWSARNKPNKRIQRNDFNVYNVDSLRYCQDMSYADKFIGFGLATSAILPRGENYQKLIFSIKLVIDLFEHSAQLEIIPRESNSDAEKVGISIDISCTDQTMESEAVCSVITATYQDNAELFPHMEALFMKDIEESEEDDSELY